jgi:hypothetical protein
VINTQRSSLRLWLGVIGATAILAAISVALLIALADRREQQGASSRVQSVTSRRPLQGSAGLQLLVADVPPFLLDVDRGTVQPITGLPTTGERGASVLPLGKQALVLSYRYCARCQSSSAYLMRHGSTSATGLGTALDFVPSRDGNGVWMLSHDAGRCTIRKVGFDGRPLGAARRVRCGTGPIAELPAGLLLSYTGHHGTDAHNALLKPDGSVIRLSYQDAQPVLGNLVLTGIDQRTPLLLHDVASDASERLAWPARPHFDLGEVTGQPKGHLAIVDFARYSPKHRYDAWLLDTRTRRWQHLPGMPAHLIPKVTDVEWTGDGRVVILSGHFLGVWRPGEPRLVVRRVTPPRQPGNQFVIW